MCILAPCLTSWSQTADPASDSLRSYEMAEIVVGDEATARSTAGPTTVQRVTLASIARQDAAPMGDVLRLIPAAHVQTNSRGETLVYLRSAGERQVALFFDGALLNVPWDNRVDLSLIPSSVVGGITVAKGVPSVLYGTNVLGGAVNMTSRELEAPGTYTEAFGRYGSAGSTELHATHLGRTQRVSYAGAVGYARRDGLPLPGGADLAYSQPGTALRTNTDRELVNVFGRVGYDHAGRRLGVSVLHLSGKKGVAPEGHIRPEEARFWRYPDWTTSMVIVNGATRWGAARVNGAVWGSRFAQTIASYGSADYDRRIGLQEDEDWTGGARVITAHALGPGTARLAVNALTSQHRQVDTNVADGDPVRAPEQIYHQHIGSVGVEYGARPGRWQGLVGVSLDALATPRTGDKPARDPQTAVGVTLGTAYDVRPTWTVRAAAGRKVRFPTLRELFGEALNRFVVNPVLRPESSLLAEVGLATRRARVAGELNLFVNRTFDTIDRINVDVEVPGGGTERRRKRVNLDGSRVLGAELAGAIEPLPRLAVQGHLAYLRARELKDDGSARPLIEKPAWVGVLTSTYSSGRGLSLLVQATLTGRAYGQREDNTLAALPTALVLDARVGYRWLLRRPWFVAAQLFVRGDNLGDALQLPQLGLPGAGRQLSAGLDVSF